MQAPEKRRGGSHVLRTGPAHAGRRASSSGHAAANANAHSNAGTNAGTNLPALPPRAAIVSGSGSSSSTAAPPDEPHDGATCNAGGAPPSAPLADRRDKDRDPGAGLHGGAKDKQAREREALAREQDERIAYLETEMGIMEREFRRELDKLSQNESETAIFWQAKHSALNRQFLDSDTELRVLRAEADKRKAERDELLQGWEALRRELRERDDEVRALRAQVRGLKEFVSTSTRTDGQTSDEVFGDGVAKLGNGLQNWVIVNFRKAKLDLSRADEATLAELGELVPMYADLVHTAKIHVLQSIVSKILVDMVFNAYFVGLSDEETRHFRQMEDLLCSFGAPPSLLFSPSVDALGLWQPALLLNYGSHLFPPAAASDEAVNQWRSSTLALLRREAPQLLHAETSALVESVVARINRILDAITAPAAAPPSSSSEQPAAPRLSETRDAALRVLVNSAVELARLLVVQRAVLRVHMPEVLPHARVVFEPETMEDVGGLEEEALTTREIGCVVFPGLIKHGDESGGQMQFRNVIAKARVLCSPSD
ncbi:hypothetical protein HRG_000910 [Hirsutella rhossiliensis]|uniref:Uncharacterized protein n=1 Tax=Hirsutella rhossiliensis TaxID=111463 RepID=A0A9P8SM72_9HYPO|nr:uncharacterized protein HRG_00910 [Hirsutella rhossiliensis]KAH0968268.1 hypothetical protein HRG_00910 [Hirsutella rhossiliensis]